ncbi:hypothetical protein Pfo_011924 [Paulownia fortunei]|nr:hypothetical protein Pfo_011924 [Paulownia fortunei]
MYQLKHPSKGVQGPVWQDWRRVPRNGEHDGTHKEIHGENNPAAYVGSRNKDGRMKGSAKAKFHELCVLKH